MSETVWRVWVAFGGYGYWQCAPGTTVPAAYASREAADAAAARIRSIDRHARATAHAVPSTHKTPHGGA